jgi:diguanylate cyclase (GGDEF)-like protein
VEDLALEVLARLEALGHLRHVEDVLQGDETLRRYRDLTTGTTLVLRYPAGDAEEGIFKVPLPLREWRGATSIDQVRTLFNLYNKILTQDSQLLRRPGDMLRQVMATARQVLQCERISFWSPQGAAFAEELQELITSPYDEELAREWVLGKRYLVYVPELPAEIDPATRTLETEFRSLAMIPVGAVGHLVYGVLEARSVRPGHFDPDRQGLLSLLSEFATEVLARSEILETLVFVDAGTQVYNRAYFNLQLENEIARARREGASLALAIADIDDFRTFNTRYGYEGGNHVLAGAAGVLKRGLRPFDSVARWGGEEFALILTAPVSAEDARAVCERLRQATELSRFHLTGLAGESITTGITITLGGALFPADGQSAQDLWRAANAALVHAKKSGKNRVVFAADLPPRPSGKSGT